MVRRQFAEREREIEKRRGARGEKDTKKEVERRIVNGIEE